MATSGIAGLVPKQELLLTPTWVEGIGTCATHWQEWDLGTAGGGFTRYITALALNLLFFLHFLMHKLLDSICSIGVVFRRETPIFTNDIALHFS